MNKKTQIGIFGLNYENNLENFYIDAFKKLKYKNIRFLHNNFLFYIFCILRKINNKFLFKIFNLFQYLKFKNFINNNNLDILIIFKGIELNSNIYEILKKKKILLINIFTDDPFNLNSSATSSKNIIKNIKNYDIFCIWSKRIKKKLEKTYKQTNFYYLPFGYSEEKHKPRKNNIINKKISFIGSYDKKRFNFLKRIKRKVDIYGNDWPSFENHKIYKYIKNKSLSKVIAQSEISLNILKKQNFLSHNMRTFEITSMGGLMLTTRTKEQKDFFPENIASFMFDDIEEINKKIEYIFNNPTLSKKIRVNAYDISKKHSYKNRVNCLIKYINANKKYFHSKL